MWGVRLALSLAACCAIGAGAAAPVRPVCTFQNLGRFWPDEANDNPKFAAALMPYFASIAAFWAGDSLSYSTRACS